MYIITPELCDPKDVEYSVELLRKSLEKEDAERAKRLKCEASTKNTPAGPAGHIHQSAGLLSTPTASSLSGTLLASAHSPSNELKQAYDLPQKTASTHGGAIVRKDICFPPNPDMPPAQRANRYNQPSKPSVTQATGIYPAYQHVQPHQIQSGPYQYPVQSGQYQQMNHPAHYQQPIHPGSNIGNLAHSHLDVGTTQNSRALASNYSAMQRYVARGNPGQTVMPRNTGASPINLHAMQQTRASAGPHHLQVAPTLLQKQPAMTGKLQFGPLIDPVRVLASQKQQHYAASNAAAGYPVSSQSFIQPHLRTDANTTLLSTTNSLSTFSTPDGCVTPGSYMLNSRQGSDLSMDSSSLELAFCDWPYETKLFYGRALGFYFEGTSDLLYRPPGEDLVYTFTECVVIFFLQRMGIDLPTIVEVLRFHRSDYNFTPDLTCFLVKIGQVGGEAFARLARVRHGPAAKSWIEYSKWTWSTWRDGMGEIVRRSFSEGMIDSDGYVKSETGTIDPNITLTAPTTTTWESILRSTGADGGASEGITPSSSTTHLQQGRPSVWDLAGVRNPLAGFSPAVSQQQLQADQQLVDEAGCGNCIFPVNPDENLDDLPCSPSCNGADSASKGKKRGRSED